MCNGYTLDLLDVNASFVQGSAIGPGMYVVNAGDLQVVTPGNSLMKYVNDTLLGDTRLQCGQSRQRNFQRRRVVAGQQPHDKPCEICRDHLPRQPEAMLHLPVVAATGYRACYVA